MNTGSLVKFKFQIKKKQYFSVSMTLNYLLFIWNSKLIEYSVLLLNLATLPEVTKLLLAENNRETLAIWIRCGVVSH